MTFTTRPELHGHHGMVASTHWIASQVGMAVLERGGNAFDAAVAAGLTLQVVEPHLNGPGGDLPAIVYSAHRGRPEVICGQGPAPAAATIQAFRRLGLELIPGTGLLAPCVPGAFGAWMLILAEYGTWSVADVLAYAIYYAEQGFPALPRIVQTIAGVEQLFREEWTESGRLWLRGGSAPAAGGLLINPDLAATYRRVVTAAEAAGGGREGSIEAARACWYEGFVAETIDRFLRENEAMDVTGRRHRGLLTGADMAAWRAGIEAPVVHRYQDWEVYKCGPWSQGPTFLQQLALLEGFDLAGLDPRGAEFIHLVVESAKLAFADREAWYGDPDFTPDLVDELLAPGYTGSRRALIGETASLELRPGSPNGRVPRLPRFGTPGVVTEDRGVGDPTLTARGAVRGDTCHLDIADRWGNLVSATPSGGWLQSSPAIPGLGFCLGSRAQIFTLEEGLPNSLAPGKRPRTTLSPSFAIRSDGTRLAFGTPGADQQDQWSMTFFATAVATGWNLQRTIDAPIFHTNHFPSSFYPRESFPGRVVVEERVAPEVVAELRRRGHEVVVTDPWALGRLSAVSYDPATGEMRAAANPRGMQGYAAGR